MLNFSDTVCVFKSSSLPAREGALESSNGEMKGPLEESRVLSELQLVRREDTADNAGDSSLYMRDLDFVGGGNSISADSATPPL